MYFLEIAKSLRKYLSTKSYIFPLVLVLMSLWDLRVEIRLLIQNFTFTAFFYAIYEHPLAIMILLISPRMRIKKN